MTPGFRCELAARYVHRLTRLHKHLPPGDAELVKNPGIYDWVASILRDWCLAPNTSQPQTFSPTSTTPPSWDVCNYL